MKKILALVVAALLTLSLCFPALAEGDDSPAMVSDESSFTFTKTFTINGPDSKYPHETLSFTITPDDNNPDTSKLITVGTDNTFTVTGATNEITVNTPVYEKVGLYKYTIKENEGDTQGVTYDTDTVINVVVLVTYNYADGKLDVKCGVAKPEDGDKEDTINNAYTFGGGDPDDPDDPDNPDDPDDPDDPDEPTPPGTKSLRVRKKVTGNLGDITKYFTIHVTLTATKTVRSDIAISGGSNSANPTSIPAGEGWTGSKTVDLLLKDGETVQFDYIPEGISYSVVEDGRHLEGDVNGEEGYTATYGGRPNGEIKKASKPLAKITNDKDTTIATGITLETLPYILVLGLALVGVVLMIVRRRRNED